MMMYTPEYARMVSHAPNIVAYFTKRLSVFFKNRFERKAGVFRMPKIINKYGAPANR